MNCVEYEGIADLLTRFGITAPDGKPWTTERLNQGGHHVPFYKSENKRIRTQDAKIKYEEARQRMWNLRVCDIHPAIVAQRLNLEGFKTFSGKEFTEANVRSIHRAMKKRLRLKFLGLSERI